MGRRLICSKLSGISSVSGSFQLKPESVIALWLGHESIETPQMYLDADLDPKQRILDRMTPPTGRSGPYRPDDKLLAFLKGL